MKKIFSGVVLTYAVVLGAILLCGLLFGSDNLWMTILVYTVIAAYITSGVFAGVVAMAEYQRSGDIYSIGDRSIGEKVAYYYQHNWKSRMLTLMHPVVWMIASTGGLIALAKHESMTFRAVVEDRWWVAEGLPSPTFPMYTENYPYMLLTAAIILTAIMLFLSGVLLIDLNDTRLVALGWRKKYAEHAKLLTEINELTLDIEDIKARRVSKHVS